jgi:hypothetical protein
MNPRVTFFFFYITFRKFFLKINNGIPISPFTIGNKFFTWDNSAMYESKVEANIFVVLWCEKIPRKVVLELWGILHVIYPNFPKLDPHQMVPHCPTPNFRRKFSW